jgi:phage terminase large subunit-like protein
MTKSETVSALPATYPAWVFDGSPIEDPFGYGERAVRFLRLLKHPKNPARGHSFQIDPWQERVVRRIYGPRHKDGRRVVETVLLLLPRGNRKTSLSAALALLHTIGPERLPGGEVLFAASDKKQAAIAFRESHSIVQADPRITKEVRVSDAINATKRIMFKRDGTFLETISSDAGTQHGRTPTFALVDELHAWKKRDLWEAIRSGLPKTRGSLMMIATTAGRGQDNLAHEIVDYARKVARGEIANPAFLPILFEAPKDADWQDERLWYAVNPGLRHGYPDLEGLRSLAREAKDRPGDRDAFRQLQLNTWLDHSTDPFVDMAIYDEGAGPIDLEALRGEPCWIGVDMSVTTDLTAVIAAFRDGDDGYIVVPHIFCPADNLRARADRDGVPYPQWAEAGSITATPGEVIDYRAVESCIRDLCRQFDVREIAFDKAYAQPVMAPLLEDGFPVVTMQLGWITQSPALNELERAIIARRFRHDGNPVLRWCFSNVAIQKDAAGNRTMHKGKSTDRIDAAFATWMAVARAAAGGDDRSIYDDVTARPEGLLVF